MHSMNQRAGAKLSGYFNLCCIGVFSISTKKPHQKQPSLCSNIVVYLNFNLEERKTNEGVGGEMHLQNKLDTLFCYNT